MMYVLGYLAIGGIVCFLDLSLILTLFGSSGFTWRGGLTLLILIALWPMMLLTKLVNFVRSL